jgi:chromosome partitioning protein
MPVIALVGNKGGAGKTTLCINLASALAERDATVVLDADPQQSSHNWHAIANGGSAFPVIAATEDVADAAADHAAAARYVLIDCPPSVHSRQTSDALSHADLALIPVQPSPLDLWASAQIEAEVGRARESNPDLGALLVINQLEPRTRLSQVMRDALAELSLPAAQSAISRRMVYKKSVIQGKSVLDVGSQGAAAAEEIRQLVDEMVELL